MMVFFTPKHVGAF